MIYIISSPKNSLGLNAKSTWVEIVPRSFKASDEKIQSGDQIYLDISGLAPAELKKALAQLKKSSAASFWGVIDPKGASDDPALFFFEGASDYIGPALVKKGLDKKRFAAALSHALSVKSSPGADRAGAAAGNRKGQKLPAGKFEGWKSIRAGTTAPFFFLFVSLSDKVNLRSLLGDTAFSPARKRLTDALQQALREADALLWMETENSSLFLIPPRAANGRAAVEAGLKLVLNSRIIGIEKMGLSVPVDFTAALHYGKTAFRAPGKTGAVIAEAVNYIFHLATKKAETGRLTISDDVPDEALPEGLLDLFTPAGVYEGIPIRHSRKFRE